MGIKIKNKIVDDFNKSYDCKLTAEDIITKTDYFNTSPQTSQKVNPLFKVRYSYAFMYVLIIFLSLSVCGLFGYNQYIKKVDYCHQRVEVEPTLTDKDIEYISKYAIRVDYKSILSVSLSKGDKFCIYKAYSLNNPNYNIYFFKVNSRKPEYNYILTNSTETIIIDENNYIGILTTDESDNSLYDKFIFNINDSKNILYYSFELPK